MASTRVLSNIALLQVVIGYVGAGEFVFIATVSKDWAEIARAEDGAAAQDDAEMEFACRRTFYRAAVVSIARLRLAHAEFGLSLNATICADAYDDEKLQSKLQLTAGRVSDLSTLQVALELGLPLTDDVLCGAARSLSLRKLQWLHTARQPCELAVSLRCYAATAGSIEILQWLRKNGEIFDRHTAESAAAAGHIAVLSYLRSEGCEWDDWTVADAAANGHLKVVQFLHEHGCEWSPESICSDAAESGSIELLRYLQQHGASYNKKTMESAAREGHLAVCQFLHAAGCEWDEEACHYAALAGHTSTLRFLRENGCPWKPGQVCIAAAMGGYIDMMQYLLHEQGLAAAVRLTNMLNAAGANDHLAAAKWLRQQGADWRLCCDTGGTFT
jgi:Ankyrin repeats (3 copies)